MPLLSTRQINPEVVGSTAFKFRDDFNGTALDPAVWDVQVGTGMSVSVSASVLTISSGVVPNAVTTIYLKKYFRLPCRVFVGHRFNAAVLNIQGEVEIVSVNPDTGVPDDLDEAGFRYPSGVTTSPTMYTKNGGSTEASSNAFSMTNVTTGMTGAAIFADVDNVEFGDLSSAGLLVGARWVNADRIPDPNKLYTLRIRLTNGATAPTNQTWVFPHVLVVDYEELQAELTGGRSTAGVNSPSVMVNNMSYNNNLLFEDTATALGAGATYTGATRDNGGGNGAIVHSTTLRALAHTTVAATPGTLYIEQSVDMTNWVVTAQKALSGADAPNEPLVSPVVMRYWRVRYLNGATAQSNFRLVSSYVRT